MQERCHGILRPIHLYSKEKVISMNCNVLLCMKVSEKKWIEKLRNGEACFNQIDSYIKKSIDDKNDDQGDKYEAVFARIKKTDKRLQELRKRFGEDLEEIQDDSDNYVLLRRKSARRILVFCLYGVKAENLKHVDGSYDDSDAEIIRCKGKYEFSKRMFEDFLKISNVYGFYASAGHLFENIEKALNNNNITYRKEVIRYELDPVEEFYFEPDEKYSELMFKRKDLSYQQEIRYWLLNYSSDRLILNYKKLKDNSCGYFEGRSYVVFNLAFITNKLFSTVVKP